MRFGVDFRDAICPGGFAFHDDYFEMGDKVGRVLFLRDFGAYGLDDMVAELSAIPRSLMLSIDILPVPTAEAAKDIQSLILGVETDIARWQQRQNARSNFTATIPYDLEQQRAETKEFLDDLTTRDPVSYTHLDVYKRQVPGQEKPGLSSSPTSTWQTPLIW